MPCDASSRILELLVLLDQLWNHSGFKYPICLISKTGRELLNLVGSMMEWLGGTINKEDGAEDTNNERGQKRKREDEREAALFGSFSLRFQCVCP